MGKIRIGRSVGKGCPNANSDVEAVQRRLKDLGKFEGDIDGTCGQPTLDAIAQVQRIFMCNPDLVISPGGETLRVLSDWGARPIGKDVQLPGPLTSVWEMLSPLLPPGSHCTSGYRTIEEQRNILYRFYRTRKQKILAYFLANDKTGGKESDKLSSASEKYESLLEKVDDIESEDEVLAAVRGSGQKIAKPGKSAHQRGLALDIGGPSSIDQLQVAVARRVAKANPHLLSGRVLLEDNGCVHVEIVGPNHSISDGGSGQTVSGI